MGEFEHLSPAAIAQGLAIRSGEAVATLRHGDGEGLALKAERGLETRNLQRWVGADGQVQVFCRLAHDHARAQNFDFCRRRAAHIERRGAVAQQGAKGATLDIFHLNEGVGFVNGGGHESIGSPQHQGDRGDDGDDPPLFEHDVDEIEQIDAVVVIVRADRVGLDKIRLVHIQDYSEDGLSETADALRPAGYAPGNGCIGFFKRRHRLAVGVGDVDLAICIQMKNLPPNLRKPLLKRRFLGPLHDQDQVVLLAQTGADLLATMAREVQPMAGGNLLGQLIGRMSDQGSQPGRGHRQTG